MPAFPSGPFRVVRSEAELHEAVAALGGRVFLKIGRGGYDGRGQARIGLDRAGHRRVHRCRVAKPSAHVPPWPSRLSISTLKSA